MSILPSELKEVSRLPLELNRAIKKWFLPVPPWPGRAALYRNPETRIYPLESTRRLETNSSEESLEDCEPKKLSRTCPDDPKDESSEALAL